MTSIGRAGVWAVVVAAVMLWAVGRAAATVVVSCSEGNDVYRLIQGRGVLRCDTPADAVGRAGAGDAVMVMADGYPADRVAVDAAWWGKAREKSLRVYVEYPSDVPGVVIGQKAAVAWERGVVTADGFGGLPAGRILSPQGCVYLPVAVDHPVAVIARVAGFDTAVYGVPKGAAAMLFEVDGGRGLVATTKLSSFVTGRYAPRGGWRDLWSGILDRLQAGVQMPATVPAVVTPTYTKAAALPADAESRALARAARWVLRSRLLVSAARAKEIGHVLTTGGETVEMPPVDDAGDGSHGIQEGYSSGVRPDGTQWQRAPLRADCQAESAMVLAMGGGPDGRQTARRLVDYVYSDSGMRRGDRGDPRSPAFGLIAWGDVAPAWLVANYGDDNARVLLATIATAATLGERKWDRAVLEGLIANLRTTGRKGFRGDRIDMLALTTKGWQSFHDAQTVNPSPHFESYLWACYLWAYRATGDRKFLETAEAGMRTTMAGYPTEWRWGDTMERARMMLCLAWMVRVDGSAEHRAWLDRVANDLIDLQDACGAIRDRLGGIGGGHYVIPRSNEAYGTGETPLIQSNDDCATDQLYTSGFALLGLHEAAAAAGDARMKQAEDRLAAYLCRIQTASPGRPELDGWWFRAFDFKNWDYWASSADLGWGAWSLEAGWAQAWGAATMGMRDKGTSFWEMTSAVKVGDAMAAVKDEMQY